MTVYFYGRCSDEEHFKKGSSIETQKSKCMSYANIKDLQIDEFITEQVSGTVPLNKREKGFELLQNLKRGDHIICSALDRFSRNTLNLLTLVDKFRKEKINLHFVDVGGEVTGSDAMGSVFVKLLSVFAEFYATQLSEKQRATQQRLNFEGRFAGGNKKYGYDVDDNGFYVPCEKEQQNIRHMQFLRKQGKSYRYISEFMTKTTNKKFPVSWVHKIIQREGVEWKKVA